MLHAIQTLTQALRQATEDHNWPSVVNVDAKIAELLAAIQGKNLEGAPAGARLLPGPERYAGRQNEPGGA